MSLRNATIWTTGVMLGASFIAPCLYLTNDCPRVLFFVLCWFVSFPIVWLISGYPFLCSFIFVKRTNNNISATILLVSTIAYCILYVSMLLIVLFEYEYGGIYEEISVLSSSLGCGHEEILALLCAGVLANPVMIPAWIAAIVVEVRYRRKDKQQPE
jgi:hypothetical protein